MTNSKSLPSNLIVILRIIGWICVVTIAVLSLVPGSVRPHVFGIKQTEHFVAYAGTGALLAAGYSAKRQLAWMTILLAVYAACMEVLQIWVPGRTADVIDVVAGAVGSWTGIVLALLLQYWMSSVMDRATNT